MYGTRVYRYIDTTTPKNVYCCCCWHWIICIRHKDTTTHRRCLRSRNRAQSRETKGCFPYCVEMLMLMLMLMLSRAAERPSGNDRATERATTTLRQAGRQAGTVATTTTTGRQAEQGSDARDRSGDNKCVCPRIDMDRWLFLRQQR